MTRTAIASAFFAAVLFAGCNKPAASLGELHPVTGIVTNSGKPVHLASVKFYSEPADPNLFMTGVTDEKGRFIMYTNSGDGKARQAGLRTGSYRVVIELPQDAEQRGGQRIDWPQKVTVNAAANDFPFEVTKK